MEGKARCKLNKKSCGFVKRYGHKEKKKKNDVLSYLSLVVDHTHTPKKKKKNLHDIDESQNSISKMNATKKNIT